MGLHGKVHQRFPESILQEGSERNHNASSSSQHQPAEYQVRSNNI